MEKLTTVIFLGFSLNYFMCVFLSFGMSSVSPKLALKFIVGRLFGLVLLAIIISIFGKLFYISPKILNLMFGLMCITFGSWIYISKKCMPHSNIGFTMGFFRGMTPCLKIALIFPLIFSSGIIEAAFLMIAFGIASSIYPIVGLLIGKITFDFADKKKPKKCSSCETCKLCESNPSEKNTLYNMKNIRLMGVIILISMGFYYVLSYWH